jgi:hypothetical protein
MVLLGGLGVLLAYLLHVAEGAVGEIPWWMDAPASVGFAMVLYRAVDRHLWYRQPFITFLGVPDLRGSWTGELRSSHDEFATARSVEVEIFQTWAKILVILMNSDTGSRSHSLGGYVVDIGNGTFELVYAYQNEPSKAETGPLQVHQGTTVLRLSKDQKQLDGYYYTGRERKTHGTLVLARTGGGSVLDN